MEDLKSTEEMAEVLGISYDNLKKICQREQGLPRILVGKKALRFEPSLVIEYFKKRTDGRKTK